MTPEKSPAAVIRSAIESDELLDCVGQSLHDQGAILHADLLDIFYSDGFSVKDAQSLATGFPLLNADYSEFIGSTFNAAFEDSHRARLHQKMRRDGEFDRYYPIAMRHVEAMMDRVADDVRRMSVIHLEDEATREEELAA